mgnify:CR=1 FL=1
MRQYAWTVSLVYQAFIGERERWPLWLPVLLGLGIGGYFSLPFEPPLWAGWLAAAILGMAAWRFIGKSGFALFFLAGAVIALGIGVSGLRTWWVAAPVISGQTGAVSVSGQVRHVERLVSGQRVTLTNLHIARLGPERTPNAVRIKLMGDQPPFGPGDWLELRASLLPPPAPAMPGAFDFQRQSYFKGLGGVGFSYGKVKLTGRAPDAGIDSLGFAFERLRGAIAARVAHSFRETAVGGVATALMTGERGEIPKDVIEDMRASGLAHLLAISGLHVGLIAGIVFFALRGGLALVPSVALRYPIKKWAAVGALFAAFGYAMLAGATVPTQRAFLMIALVLLAVLFDRRAVSMRLVAWAAMAILLLSPESLLGASFQMSFSAVVGLVAVYEFLRRKGVFDKIPQTWVGKVGRYVAGVALTTAVAGLATGLFAAYHFNRVADFSLAANVIAVPATALWIMPWAVVAYVLMPLGLEGLALGPMGWGIEVVIATANEVAHWPGAVSDVAAFSVWGLVTATLGGLWLALWQYRWRLWGAPIVAVGLLSMLTGAPPDVLIHQDGKLAAVRTPEGGYSFSTLTSAKFERDVWLRRAGLSAKPKRWSDHKDDGQMRCDALGCLYQLAGRNVAFTRAPEALGEDCWRSDVLVTDVALSESAQAACRATTHLITADELNRMGTHAIWLSGGPGNVQGDEQGRVQRRGQSDDKRAVIRVQTVNGQRGDRPWVVKSRQ